VDLTIATPGLALRIINWEVANTVTLSDHNYIKYIIQTPTQDTLSSHQNTRKMKLDYRKLEEALGAGDLVNLSLLDAERCASNLAA